MEFFFILFVVGVILLSHYLKASKPERKPTRSEPDSTPIPFKRTVTSHSSSLTDFSKLSYKTSQVNDYQYELNTRLFSRAETSFFHALEAAIDGKLRIFGKVRIADVMQVKKGLRGKEWGYQFGRIKAKHFDYVLCTPNTLKIVCAIELDDSSHQRPDRVKRDEFVNAACKASGLKLHRFKQQKYYNPTDISDRIFPQKPKVEPVNPSVIITDIKQSLDTTPDLLKTGNKYSNIFQEETNG